MPHLSRAACFSSSVMGRVKQNSRSTVNGIVICGPGDARGSPNGVVSSARTVEYESVPVEVEEGSPEGLPGDTIPHLRWNPA